MNTETTAQTADNKQQLPLPGFPQFLTSDEVAGILKVARPTLYKYIDDGVFPKPVKIGERNSRWPVNDVQRIIDARMAGAKGADVRKIVDAIHAERAAKLAKQLESVGKEATEAP